MWRIHVKIRDNGAVRVKAAYLALSNLALVNALSKTHFPAPVTQFWHGES